MTTNVWNVLEIGPPYSLGDAIEVVHQGAIVRGTVVERIEYLYYRVTNDAGPDFWVILSQIIGLTP